MPLPSRQRYFSLRSLIQDLLYAHDVHEFSEFYCAGARSTTPPLFSIDARWQFPWRSTLFIVGLIIFVLLFMISEFWAREALHNVKLFLGAVVVGSIAVPLGLISFFAEMNLWRNISWLRICSLSALGGLLALILSLILFFFNINDSIFNAGFIEEPAKIIAVLLIAGHRGRNGYILNGMLLGAAVGAGFAIFESLGYAYESLFVQTGNNTITIDHQNALSVMAARSIFCLTAGHITWTSITCAALWASMRQQSLWKAFIHPIFLICLIASALIHGSWNIVASEGDLYRYAPFFGLFTWSIVALFYHMGIKQIRNKQMLWMSEESQRPLFTISGDDDTYQEPINALQLMEKVESAELTEREYCLCGEEFPHRIQLRHLFFIRALRRGREAMNWYQMPPALWFRLAQLLGLATMIGLAASPYYVVLGISTYIFCSSLLFLLMLRITLNIWEKVQSNPNNHHDELRMPAQGASLWLKFLIPIYQIYWGYVLWVRLIYFINKSRQGRMRIPLWIPRLYWTTFCLAIALCLVVMLWEAHAFVLYALCLIVLYPISAYLMSMVLMSAEKGK
ncbi:MAG: PrsW family glutamic-type intramembrane protease [Akkermansia sp.]